MRETAIANPCEAKSMVFCEMGTGEEKIETKMSHIATFVYIMYGPLGAVPGWPAARTDSD